ncbi:hypothetical protein [Saccharothrix longispora]|uniref:hypothetical protein n=1 Tax=Saccharothrix longispora TaxID=33920 RepID=UPI0028FD78E4|nr:hypothetical protein [Saccharothrix longispora]MDU0293180.1 hypothetical protein [Saccharothrix longispora]
MWKPLFDRGDGTFVGLGSASGLWVGGPGGEPKPVDLANPVFLWALLERPIEDVHGQLDEHWEEFRLAGSPTGVLRDVAVSAVRSGRDYWVTLGITWLEQMLSRDTEPVLRRQDVPDCKTDQMSQRNRHRWNRLAG